MYRKSVITLAGAALCAGALASPAHADPERPFWIALEVPERAGLGWGVSIDIHAGQGRAAGCDGCAVDLEFRAEGAKSWKKVRRKVLGADGFATTRVTVRGDGFWRARSADGKSRSGAYPLDSGFASAVKVNRPAEPRPGTTVAISGKAISQIGEKWRGIKGRQVCLYGAGQKKITCATTGPRGRFTVKVKASTRGLVFRSLGTDTYMDGGSTWFWLIRD